MELLVCLAMPPRRDRRVNPVFPDFVAIQDLLESPDGPVRRVCPVCPCTDVLDRRARKVTRVAMASMDLTEAMARRVTKDCRAFGARLVKRDRWELPVFPVLLASMVCPVQLVLLVLLAIPAFAATRVTRDYLVWMDSRVPLDPLVSKASSELLESRVSAVSVVNRVFRPPFRWSAARREHRASKDTPARRANVATKEKPV